MKDLPFVICHMIESVDGRVGCPMTEHLPGMEDCYSILDSLNCDAFISGRHTAELEMPLKGEFVSKEGPIGQETVYVDHLGTGFEVIMGAKGTLLWEDRKEGNPLLIVTSELASVDYLAYLKERHISYIATGKEHIDLARSLEIMKASFGFHRVAIVGGPKINAGLLDEISMIIGSGIDGREGYEGSFDGLKEGARLHLLKIKEVKQLENAVWIIYSVKN